MDDIPTRDTKKLVLWALAANLMVASCKLSIALITRSTAIFAEGVHSIADSINQVLLLYGMKQSRKEPTDLHPFGYARESYFWSFMVAVFLFTLGGFFSIYQGIQKITYPTDMGHWHLAYIVLALSAFFEGLALRKAFKMVQEKRKNQSLYSFIKGSKEPELIIVFLEDLASEIGIFIAFIGVGLSHLTGKTYFDGMATIMIGVLLGCMAMFLTLEVRSLMMGEKASQLDEYKIRRAIRDTNTVEEVIKLSTQHLGPDEIMVAMNCRFPDYYNSQEIAEAIDAIGERIRKRVPHARQIFIEPELAREE